MPNLELHLAPRAALAFLVLIVAGTVARADFRDAAQPRAVRVQELIAQLTLEEKASLLHNGSPGVPRLGIPAYDWWNEGMRGVKGAGPATVFPHSIALAATWDPAFVQQVADAVATEARVKYAQARRAGKSGRFVGLTFWTPNINLFRDPRWGRGQETYGEDPFLTSQIGCAFVRGLQGDDPRYLKTSACAKHFAVHSGPEPLRHSLDAQIDDADLHETYLPAFEALVRDAHVAGVMTAYSSLNGEPCVVNRSLYAQLERWGFHGYVVSDCGSIRDLQNSYKLAADPAAAEALALRAGLSLCCAGEKPAAAEAVQRGLLTEKEIDGRLARLLDVQFALGLFDPPERVPFTRIAESALDSPAHRALALAAARRSIVLLKNDGTLPLRADAAPRVAVIGPNAASAAALVGEDATPPGAVVSVLDGLQRALGADRVSHARGCSIAPAVPGVAVIQANRLTADHRPGLLGDYFANARFEGAPAATRRDKMVDFDGGAAARPGGVTGDAISVRWRGQLRTGAAGDYTIAVEARGQFRLFVDDQLALDAWTPAEHHRSTRVALPADREIPVRLEYARSDGAPAVSLRWQEPSGASELAEALRVAREADVIVFAGGLSPDYECEQLQIDVAGFLGGDRTHIELPAPQQKLLEDLVATGKPVVVVFLSGGAVASPWAQEHAAAILQAWYPGQAGGTALADVLLGKTNPSGRLPVTFYRATKDLPVFTDYRMAGRTYRYFEGKPLYPFGFGLSYTQFAYEDFVVEHIAGSAAFPQTARVKISNRGQCAGDEVVQLYAEEPSGRAHRARRSLCGFQRIHLEPGESRTVEIPIHAEPLRRWNAAAAALEVPAGRWRIAVGASSEDLRSSAELEL